MSTPMFDLPEHFPIAVNKDGNGPECNPEMIDRLDCWCGTLGCEKYKETWTDEELQRVWEMWKQGKSIG